MRPIITEELRLRKRICEFAIKHGNNAEAARRYPYGQTTGVTVVKKIRRNHRFIASFKPKTAYTDQPTHDSRISYS